MNGNLKWMLPLAFSAILGLSSWTLYNVNQLSIGQAEIKRDQKWTYDILLELSRKHKE